MSIAGDQFAPAFGELFSLSRDSLAVYFESAVRPGPDPGVSTVSPIEKIVPRFAAWPRMIGNLVGRTTGRCRQLLRHREKIGRQPFARDLQHPASMQLVERRRRFDRQLVERKMLGAEG